MLLKINNQLYNAAKARGFEGSYAQFAEECNRFNSSQVSEPQQEDKADAFLNDTGATPAPEQPVKKEVPPPPTAEKPSPAPAPVVAKPEPVQKDEEDKILGLNKWVFIAIAALAVLGVGGLAFYFIRKGKNTVAPLAAVQQPANVQQPVAQQPAPAPGINFSEQIPTTFTKP